MKSVILKSFKRYKSFFYFTALYGFIMTMLLSVFSFVKPLKPYSFVYLKSVFLKQNDIVSSLKRPETDSLSRAPQKKTLKKHKTVYHPHSEPFLIFTNYERNRMALMNSSVSEDQKNLDHFFEALLNNIKSQNKHHTKITLIGDSLVSGDILPGFLRSHFQNIFGNGGPGFVCIRKPYKTYYHQDVRFNWSGQWYLESYLMKKLSDHFLGLNGFSFIGKKNEFCELKFLYNPVTHLKFYYLKEPNSGTVRIKTFVKNSLSGPTNVYRLDASYPRPAAAFLTINSKRPVNKFNLSVTTEKVRIFGAELYHKSGLTFNTFPMLGAEISKIKRIDEDLWMRQLKETDADLVILMFWGNKSTYVWLEDEVYKEKWDYVFKRIKKALPDVSVLTIGPIGVSRKRQGRTEVKPIIFDMIRCQKEICKKYGYSFIDLYEMLGGAETMRRWYEEDSKMLNRDRVHLSRLGSKKVSSGVFETLMSEFRVYLMRGGYL